MVVRYNCRDLLLFFFILAMHGWSLDLTILGSDQISGVTKRLLTPPDTPLFPSLDDETTSTTVAHRGRPRSQPITISRSSTVDYLFALL